MTYGCYLHIKCMDGVSDMAEYASSSFDEESQESKEQDNDLLSSSEEDSGVFYFESDQLALKGNKDYHDLLRTIVILEAQREQAVRDIEKVVEFQKEVEENPLKIIEDLKQGKGIPIPGRQTLPEIPNIDWSRYNLPAPPESCKLRNRTKITNDSDSPGNSFNKIGTHMDNREKRQKILVRGRAFDDSKPETFNQLWTSEEQRRLEELLVEYPPEEVETRRWKKIADALGNRTAKQVQSRVQKYFIKLHKAGLPIPGRSPRLQNESQLRKAFHKHQRNNHFLFKPSTFFPCHDVPMSMSDSDEESNIPKQVFPIKEEPSDDKDENEDDGDGSNALPEEIKKSDDFRKLEVLKKVKREMEKANGTTKVEHVGYQCDLCKEEPIIGTRWHCDVCMSSGESVDYCSDCVISLTEEPDNPFTAVNPKPFHCSTNLHPLVHALRPIRGRTGKTTAGVWDPDYMPESFYGGYNYLDPNFMPD